MRELTVTSQDDGGRLDKYLQKYMPKAPKSFFYKMFRKKNITVNKKKCDGSERLSEGDLVQLFLADDTIDHFRGDALEVPDYPYKHLEILYEDEQVLMINKPAGMLSQKAEKSDVSLNEYMIGHLLREKAITKEQLQHFHPSVCNRLDRNTSGIITAGKTLGGLQNLSMLLRERTVEKYYLCMVKGKVKQEGMIRAWLLKDHASNQVQILDHPEEGAEEIRTGMEILRFWEGNTLLRIRLITGKSHQIRAHLASIGHPIAGDPKYGDREWNRSLALRFGLKRQFLHCQEMVFPKLEGRLSGLSGQTIEAPLPYDLRRVLEGIQK